MVHDLKEIVNLVVYFFQNKNLTIFSIIFWIKLKGRTKIVAGLEDFLSSIIMGYHPNLGAIRFTTVHTGVLCKHGVHQKLHLSI